MIGSASTTAGRFNRAGGGAREGSIDSFRRSPGPIGQTVRRRPLTGRGGAAVGAAVAAIARLRPGMAPRISRGEARGRPSPSRPDSQAKPNRLVPAGPRDHRGSPDRRNAVHSHARMVDPVRIHRRRAAPGRGRRARAGTRSAAGAAAAAGEVPGRMDRRRTPRRAREGNRPPAPDHRRPYLPGIEWCS